MKKSYLMIAAAVVLFTACAEKDTFKDVDSQDVPIGFNYNGTTKNTRAELDINWFKTVNNAFGVYGYKIDSPIFTDERVYCSTTDASISNCEWSHSTVRFWDKSAEDAYYFYAYAPYVAPSGSGNNITYNPAFDKTNEKFTFSGINLIADIENDGADKVVAKAVRGIDYADVKDHKHNNKPTVQFDFHHILSKLSFKVYTEIAKANVQQNTGVATFTLKRINIDFPQSEAVTDNVDFYASDFETAASRNLPKGTTSYTGTPVKDNAFDGTDAADDDVELVFYCEDGYEVPNSATKPALPASPKTNDVACKTYIVAPVNSTRTAHEFGISVEYDVEYVDGTTEEGCKATSTLSYSPAQNSHHVVIIKIDPAQINFCVESVADWDTETAQNVTVD